LTIILEQALEFKYPEPKTTKLDFNKNDLGTFEGTFTVTAIYTGVIDFPLQLNISLQTCSNQICLAPSNTKLKVL